MMKRNTLFRAVFFIGLMLFSIRGLAQPLIITSPTSGTMCAGETLTIHCHLAGATNDAYSFELANDAGFTSPDTLLTIHHFPIAAADTAVIVTLPAGLSGTTYKIRINGYNLPAGDWQQLSNVVGDFTIGTPSAISGSSTVCKNATTALTNSTAGGSWSSSNTFAATVNANTGVVSGLMAGTTTISYSLGSCTVTKDITVDSVEISGLDNVCVGSTIALLTSGTGGTWESSNDLLATVSSSGAVTGMGAGNVTITYTSASQCPDTYAVTVNEIPVISGTNNVCVGATTNLSAPAGGTWESSDNTLGSISTTGVVTGLIAGNIAITYTSAANCVNTYPVTVKFLPTNITGPNTVCYNSTVTLGSTPTNGTWSTPSSNVTVGASGLVTGVAPTTAVAIVTYTLPNACYKTQQMTINPLPEDISGASSFCAGGTTGYSVTLTDATSAGTWSSSNDALASISSTGVVTGHNSFSAGNVTFTYTLPTTCYKTKTLTANPIPTLTVTSDTVCNGGPITATFGPSSVRYDWTTSNNIGMGSAGAGGFGYGGIGPFTAVNGSASSAVTSTITVIPSFTVTGCANVAQTFTITVNNTIDVNDLSGFTTTVCNKDSVGPFTFTGTANDYQWSSIGLGISGTGDIIERQPVKNLTTAAITATVTVTPKTPGCNDGAAKTFTVTIRPTPTKKLTYFPAAICDSLPFYDTLSTDAIGLVDKKWRRVSVTGIIGGPDTTGTGDVNEYLHNTTPNAIDVIYYDTLVAAGCRFDTMVKVTVHPTPKLSNTLTRPTICNNGIFTFNATSATSDASFSWMRLLNDSISNVISSGVTANANETLNNIGVTDSAKVKYVFTVRTGPAALNCSNGARDTVEVHVMPTLTLSTPVSGTLCSHNKPFNTDTFKYVPGSAVHTPITYQYTSVRGSSNIDSLDLTVSHTDTIRYILYNRSTVRDSITYTYKLTAQNGCTANATVKAYVNPTPHLTKFIDSVCDALANPYMPSSLVTDISSFKWTRFSKTGLSNPTASAGNADTATGKISETLLLDATTFTPVTTQYIYTITTGSGCKDADTLSMKVNPIPHLTALSKNICSGEPLNFASASKTGTGTKFTWQMVASPTLVKGPTFKGRNNDNDSTGVVLDTLFTKYLQNPITVKYGYAMTHRGCTSNDTVTVVVNPRPQKPVISSENMTPCSGSLHQNFYVAGSDSKIQSDKVKYTWTPSAGIEIEKTNADGSRALITFKGSGTLTLKDSAFIVDGGIAYRGCSQVTDTTVMVNSNNGNGANKEPGIMYNKKNRTFFCLQNNVRAASGYVWGYEDASSLKEEDFPNEKNQFFKLSATMTDPSDNSIRYYVKTINDGGCIQKAYYDPNGKMQTAESRPAISVTAYPNPAQSNITFELNDVTISGSLEIFDVISGKNVFTGTIANGKEEMSIATLNPGNYIVVCRQNGEKIASTQFIKN